VANERLFMHNDIGIDRMCRLDHIQPLANIGDVLWRQHRIKRIAEVGDKPLMHPRPEGGLLQIRVHSWEGARHTSSSLSILICLMNATFQRIVPPTKGILVITFSVDIATDHPERRCILLRCMVFSAIYGQKHP
jgi:hypothetical protein